MLTGDSKINHLGLPKFPKRSSVSSANKKRSSEVFVAFIKASIILKVAQIYFNFQKHYLKHRLRQTLSPMLQTLRLSMVILILNFQAIITIGFA
jgi:hypothetical protein